MNVKYEKPLFFDLLMLFDWWS